MGLGSYLYGGSVQLLLELFDVDHVPVHVSDFVVLKGFIGEIALLSLLFTRLVHHGQRYLFFLFKGPPTNQLVITV